jgi:hypothetical protein
MVSLSLEHFMLRKSTKHSSRSSFETLEARRLLAAHIVGSTVSYATIQAAVNAASAGATITVDAGTYNEEVTVNKQLNIQGANAGIDARTRATANESIVDGATSSGIVSASFYISANDVTIDGFTVQGETNQSTATGAGIVIAPGISGTHIIDDIIQNNVAGIYLTNSSSTDPALMQHDLFQNNNNTGTNGGRGIYTDGGISGGNLTNVVIDSNTFYNNHGGADTTYAEAAIAFEAATPGRQSNITITNNTFTSNGKAVLFFNTTNVVIQGNTITGQTDSAGTLRFEGGDSNVSIDYNTVQNNGGTGVAIDSKGVAYPDSNFTIEYNNFINNSADWGDAMSVIDNAQDYNGALIAINNWWNSTSGPGGDGTGTGGKIYGNGYWVSGHQWTELTGGDAIFSPWATAAINIAAIPIPSAPSGLQTSILSSSSIQLNWTAPISTTTSELVQRSTDDVNFSTIATVSPLINTYTDSGLPSLGYYYRVIASNSTNNSAPSNVASTLPAIPTQLAAVAISTSQINLTWTDNAAGIENGFIIQRSTDGVNYTQLATVTKGVTAYSDTSLAAGTTYYYRVSATAVSGNSAFSSPASASTIASSTISTPISSLNWVSATAGWGSVQTNQSVGGNPLMLRGVTYTTGLGTHAASTIVYNIAGLGYTNFLATVGVDDEENGKGTGSVDFQVIGDGAVLFDSGVVTNNSPAVNLNVSVAGISTLTLVATNGIAGSIDYDHADWAGAVLLAPANQVPAAPSNLVAVTSSASQVNLTWTSTAANAAGFIIQRSTDGVNFTQVATTASNVTTYFDKTAVAGTAYTYRVLATNAGGNSLPSNVATATTLSSSSVVTNLSSLAWVSATAGWGSVQTNSTVSGNTITLRGVTYASGIGTHAVSNIVYNLNGAYTNFISDVGVDDEENSKGIGSVDFQVIGDGKVLFDSGVLTNNSPIVSLDVSVVGVQQLTLVASNGVVNSIDYDHSDWAGAKLISVAAAPAATPANQFAPSTVSSVPVVDLADTQAASVWSNTLIGNVGQVGDASETSSTITLTGVGTGTAGTTDSVDYAYQTLAGDGTLIAHVDTTQTGTGEAGLMIRDSLAANSPEVSLLISSNQVKFARRTRAAAKTKTAVTRLRAKAATPEWVKLVRKGKTIIAYDSVDGVHWKRVGSTTMNLNVTLDVGLTSDAGNTTSTNPVVFSNTAVSPAPVVTKKK